MSKPFSHQDHYFHLAKKMGYRARSAFKLIETLEKYPKLLPKKANVLDLGAAPGSFLQVLGEKNAGGNVCGVDLQIIEKFPKNYSCELKLIQGDVFEESTAKKILEFFGDKKADLITSDLAPRTSGIKGVDQWKSIELNERVIEVCDMLLKKNGNLIAKIFKGEDFEEFWVTHFRDRFEIAKTFKPNSCRDRSVEFFLVGIGWKGSKRSTPQSTLANDLLE